MSKIRSGWCGSKVHPFRVETEAKKFEAMKKNKEAEN